MESVRIQCPVVKPRKLEVCPICHMSPCQCGRGSIMNESKKNKKFNKTKGSCCKKGCRRSVSKKKSVSCKSLKCTRGSFPACAENQESLVNENDCINLWTQELINFCWLLLTPETLNRLRTLLHDNHGYSSEEADDYIERKQNNVLNYLTRLMPTTVSVIPFSCNVMNLINRKPECEHQVLSNNLQLQTIFEKLVKDIRNESRRLINCSARYKNNNSNSSGEVFTPWQRESTTQEMISHENVRNDCFSKKYDECFRCLTKILTRNNQVSDVTITTYPNYVHFIDNCDGNAKTVLRYPCRSIMKDPKSNYTIITSCCEPHLQVVKDQSTDNSTCIAKTQDTQTVPTTLKQVRSQSVQTELTGKDTSAQTELPQSNSSFKIPSAQCDETPTEKNAPLVDSKDKENLDGFDLFSLLEQKLETKEPEPGDSNSEDKLDDLFSMLDHELGKKEPLYSNEKDYLGEFDDIFSILENRLESKEKPIDEEQFDKFDDLFSILENRLESKEKPIDEEQLDKFDDLFLLLDHQLENTGVKSEVEHDEGLDEKFIAAKTCDETSGSSIIYYEARDLLASSLESSENSNIRPTLVSNSEYVDANDECDYENMRTLIFMNKKARETFDDDTKSVSYHTPPYQDEHPQDHVRFNIDFNEEEVMSRIFDLVEDELCEDEMFQSVSCSSDSSITSPRRTSFHFNHNLEMSEIPHDVQDKKGDEDK